MKTLFGSPFVAVTTLGLQVCPPPDYSFASLSIMADVRPYAWPVVQFLSRGFRAPVIDEEAVHPGALWDK